VTAKAGPGAATAGMTGCTAAIGIAVIHREGVTESGRFPGVGGVALRALPGEVVGRP
jgi:hypothetical protein